MSFFPDGTQFQYPGSTRPIPRTSCVGWLSGDSAGCDASDPVDIDTQADLLDCIVNHSVRTMRGCHVCELCPREEDPDAETYWIPFADGCRVLLGHQEIWLPSESEDVFFVAPTLVYHYISVHGYRPPDDFLNSVRQHETLFATKDLEREFGKMPS